MKRILFLTLVILFNVAKGQNYFPLSLDSTIVWRVDFNGHDAASACSECNIPYQYITEGDTIINSIAYTKIKATGWSNCFNSNCGYGVGLGYRGAVRQDTVAKKVYVRLVNSTTERILYDFTQIVGDTVNSVLAENTGPFIIESIDSILIGSLYHKRFNLNYAYTSLIEGVGSTQGLLNPLGGFEFGSLLVCVSHFNQTIYPDATSPCDMVGITEEKVSGFNIYPNPFKESFEITLSKPVENIELIIYDLFSRPIFNQKYRHTRAIPVKPNSLPAGIYLYKLTSENKIISTGKIVAE